MLKYTLREMPDMDASGKRRVYPALVADRKMDTNGLLRMMKHYHRMPPGTVLAVLADLHDMLQHALKAGYTVKIDGLGTFALSLAFDDEKPTEMQTDDDRMLYRHVRVRDVNFRPSADFLTEMNLDVDFERVPGGVRTLSAAPGTSAERLQRAVEIVREKGFITLGEYAAEGAISRARASAELKQICSDPASPLGIRGRGSHKVWVMRETT